MTPKEYREEQDFKFDHFTKLTSTSIVPDYENIELFAQQYHEYKLKNPSTEKLKNTEQDRQKLHLLLSKGIKPKALIELGSFTSELASSFEIKKYEGVITDIDLDSGYCNWENVQGTSMPNVNINTVTLYTPT
jgi:hypothetical protein